MDMGKMESLIHCLLAINCQNKYEEHFGNV